MKKVTDQAQKSYLKNKELQEKIKELQEKNDTLLNQNINLKQNINTQSIKIEDQI